MITAETSSHEQPEVRDSGLTNELSSTVPRAEPLAKSYRHVSPQAKASLHFQPFEAAERMKNY